MNAFNEYKSQISFAGYFSVQHNAASQLSSRDLVCMKLLRNNRSFISIMGEPISVLLK